ncbi:hypothetical protein IAQ61_009196 [Plenodomus lingam]|uniref:Predicted protein n=1 Tax=Leptosphaeria maculans (strain JN3 / isolate v23.1.3 / race Av1-4-5-6-7-8) TaxID=985895 RepID=E4ZPW8_LEPMJ|nr:predicted protein [Plenodomus lingam JN3]KAH9865249.1 hypothetical protein IAQ61_009196 [Plenodomus lingam]CBX93503.1 predicted protein [Plenodomus lingam JN3]
MRFFAVVAGLAAVAAAQYGAEAQAPQESCAAPVTVTVTKTMGHTPSPPSVATSSGTAPYPTNPPVVSPPVPVGTGIPTSANTPLGGVSRPTGTGASMPPIPEFTGAASSVRVGGLVAGVGAVVALMM